MYIPTIVKGLQVLLEGLAGTSPACGVDDHYELVVFDATPI